MKRKTFSSDSGLRSASKAKNQRLRMRKERKPFSLWLLCATLLLPLVISGCMASKSGYEKSQEQAQQFIDKHTAGTVGADKFDPQALVGKAPELPTRFQSPSFLLAETDSSPGRVE